MHSSVENKRSFIRFCLLLGILSALCVGCIGEEMSACAEYAVSVKIVDPQGNDLSSSGRVTSVDLYLFDEQGFVRVVPRGSSESFLLGEEKNKELTLVAWGNLNPDSISVPSVELGTSAGTARLDALPLGAGMSRTISDLFYSRLHISPLITRGIEQRTDTLVLGSVSSGMRVQTTGLHQWLGSDSDSCRVVIENAAGSLNFLGELVGQPVGYEPVVNRDASGDLHTGPFRVLPTGISRPLTLSIYNGSSRVFSVSSDTEGNPIIALAGYFVDLSVHFEYASIKTVVTVVPWDEIRQDTQF